MKTIQIVSCLLLFICARSLPAQRTDSLKTVLGKTVQDTSRVLALLAICEQEGDITDLEREQYAREALALSQKLNYRKGFIRSVIMAAIVDNILGRYDEAIDRLQTALKLTANSQDKLMLARIYNCLGVSWASKSDYSAALSWYMKSLTLYEEAKNDRRAADLMNNMSNVYYQIKDYDKASGYELKAAAVYDRLRDTIRLLGVQTQLGNIAYDQYQHAKAINYYENALKMTKNLKDQSYAASIFIGLGNVSFDLDRFEEAVSYHEKALEMSKNSADDYYIATSLMVLGREYAYVNKFRESEKLLKEAIVLSRKLGTKKITYDAYSYLAETYQIEKNYKQALEYCWKYTELKDTVLNEETAELINDLNRKYENEKKEKSIALLNAKLSDERKSQELLQAKVKEKNITIISVIGGMILVLMSASLFYSRQRLREKNRFQEELNDQQKQTAGTIIQMLEDERNRIARELHDGIGTYISTLKINLQVLEHNVADEKLAPHKNNSELLDKTSEELRKITRGLSNEALQEKGLAPALHQLVNSIPPSGTRQIQFLTDETNHRFDVLLETNYYRVAQELINNSIKHSQATVITLQLIDHDTDVLLMLEDNGIGFDMEKGTAGMGLKNIRNRIDFLGGTFKIESVREKGSTFIIEVPKKAA